MPEIKNYIDDNKQNFDHERYLRDLTAAMATKETVEDIRRYAYAVMVLEVERAASVFKWLAPVAFWMALNGYAETVREYSEKTKKQ